MISRIIYNKSKTCFITVKEAVVQVLTRLTAKRIAVKYTAVKKMKAARVGFALLTAIVYIISLGVTSLQAQPRLIRFTPDAGALSDNHECALASKGQVAPVLMDSLDYKGVAIAADNLEEDFKRVTGTRAKVQTDLSNLSDAKPLPMAIIVGTIGHSRLIDQLIKSGSIKVDQVAGKWEATLMQVVDNPTPGVKKALVIAGSDKRGTIYGIYEISRQIGVSPWYYWADVPVVHRDEIYLVTGTKPTVLASPKVKYRGIFLNDEAPALSGWVQEQFGGFNHQFYPKVFELLLRLKANYLWPAMWGNAFNDDDTLNPVLADQYGIVMGTSHHEPMLRAQQEWKRYGKGEWNYQTNSAVLNDFWKKGIEHMGTHESIVTVGMRGDGDMPMTEGSNIALLEKIIGDQRGILSAVTGKPASQTPQLWALYKEVQAYYDKGMRVPDDITLLLCDDNWGNLRKLPALDAKYRSGGYGIYYHFDYVGDPRNYKWINTNTIERTWEQMHLAYRYGVDQIWIVNVGDLKPMEFPISFFLDYARNPDKISYDDLPAYTANWAKEQFGGYYTPEIADMMHLYTKYNARVKPELLDKNTYSLQNYQEWDRVAKAYQDLAVRSKAIYEALPKAYQAAYFELVDFQVAASSNLYQLYRAQALNHLYALQGRAVTHKYADSVRYYYLQDSLLTYRYNKVNAGGKWNHFMDQTHIGYTYWQQPEHNSLPEVKEITPSKKPLLGIDAPDTLLLDQLMVDRGLTKPVTVFARSAVPAQYQLRLDHHKSQPGLIQIEKSRGTLSPDSAGLDISFQVNWDQLPAYFAASDKKQNTNQLYSATLDITGSGHVHKKVVLLLRNENRQDWPHQAYIESDSLVSMDALGFISDSVKFSQGIRWTALPGFGKTTGAVTPMPVNFKPLAFSTENPGLSYRFYTTHKGDATLKFYLAPTLNIWNTAGLEFAYAIDDEAPVMVNINQGLESEVAWRKLVAATININTQQVSIQKPGLHTLKIWAISPAVVLERMELNFGLDKPSFLGAPVSYYHP